MDTSNRMKSRQSALELTIDELVIPHTPGRHPHRIQAAIEQELQRLLNQPQPLCDLHRTPHLVPPNREPLAMPPSATAEGIGRQIAHRIYRSSIATQPHPFERRR